MVGGSARRFQFRKVIVQVGGGIVHPQADFEARTLTPKNLVCLDNWRVAKRKSQAIGKNWLAAFSWVVKFDSAQFV